MTEKTKDASRAKRWRWQIMFQGVHWLDVLYLLTTAVAVAVAYCLGYGDTAVSNGQGIGP
ncbi:hypothetical protein [Rhizobium mesoamericanum]|uniref:hypothetical protein n=1 Tax=Rhizobium mesoamericanum TaxID=1079800 RepID=UPI0004155C3F|nr:hypothetical protein [Rhizobium mesoamericanum]